ncbi:50S ribosomal protein L1 [Patescibacteria group bacterium]|nr:MAG: 50S ribosomal protein L1 [Patescibacteria group bacterium]
MHRGKKYKNVAEKIERTKLYPLAEAIQLVKGTSIAKFDEAVEVHVNLGIDPKKSDEAVRGTVVLPHGTGKTKRVAVITSTKAKEAQEAGADVVGGEEMIERLKAGKVDDFDVLVATPEMMPKLAPAAKILGPRGLMPSPKTETVTVKIKEAIENIKKGKVNFKNDPQGVVHQVFGKISFDEQKLSENLSALLDALQKAKQSGVKGKFIKSIAICTTMGPSVRVAQ